MSTRLELLSADACVGDQMYRLVRELYPICRSITGQGVRDTLGTISQEVPIHLSEVPTGTPVFDWAVPREWNVRDAYIKNSCGEKIVDFNKCNLHVLNYSVPVKKEVSLHELKEHLFTLPEHPDWIPYRTSYYQENWGFCITHRQFLELQEEQYEVLIDSTLNEGHLTLGELLIPGESPEEVLLSAHVCHPSLCNDNLSGIALNTFLAKYLSRFRLKYSYRFLFAPGTIGAITWLALNEQRAANIKHGLVMACVGDDGNLSYKKTRSGDAAIDRAAQHILKHSGRPYNLMEFSPDGYDERQFSSPGFKLPVGSLSRTPHGRFAEYHTSADNLDFVRPTNLADSLSKAISIVYVLEHNGKYINQNPKCEPQLGKRGLYRALGGRTETSVSEIAMFWILNLSDGEHDLLDVAERAGLPFCLIKDVSDVLRQHELLKETP